MVNNTDVVFAEADLELTITRTPDGGCTIVSDNASGTKYTEFTLNPSQTSEIIALLYYE
jgi:hypothetical protein